MKPVLKANFTYTQKLPASGEAARPRLRLPRLFMSYGPVVFLLLTGLSSCETLVNTVPESKLPRMESQLTVFSFVSPQDTVIRVKVSQTVPLFGEYTFSPGTSLVVADGDTILSNIDSFTTATVVISDGVSSATLPYNSREQVYALPARQFPIKAGTTYSLTVTDGKRSAQASCTVPPEQVPIKEYTLDTALVTGLSRRDTSLILSFTWNDLAGKENYYRVKAFELFEYSVVKIDTITQATKEARTLGRSYFRWVGTSSRNVFQNDTNLDGTLFSSPQGRKPKEGLQYLASLTGGPVKPERGPENKGTFLLLLNTDSHYYRFHRSVQQAGEDNPFAEPALVYTNVKGGLGVFAAYNQSVQVIKP